MESQWYYTNQGQQSGPVSSDQLRQLAAQGRLQPTDLVWRDGMAKWGAARDVAGLFPPAPPVVAPAVPRINAPPPPVFHTQSVVQQVVIHNSATPPRKSVLVAFLLAFFFGPLGMLYSTVGGAIVMFVLSVLLAILTVGLSLLLTQPICCIWAVVAANNSR